MESYLRFSPSGLTGRVTRATLRVYADTRSVDGPAVYRVQGAWDESNVTWSTRPSRDTDALDDVGAVGSDRWIEYDVTAVVTGDGTYDFALAQTGGDGVDMSQREAEHPPQLVVETGAPPPLTTSTFAPLGDARVEQRDPRDNFGARTLRTDGGSREAVESYLRFSASGLTGKVTRATLRLFATSGSVDGPAVYRVLGAWDESTVTWNTRPGRGTDAFDDVGAVGNDRWIEFDVTAAVTGDGTYDFALAQTGGDGVDIRQREVEHGPQLVVETEG